MIHKYIYIYILCYTYTHMYMCITMIMVIIISSSIVMTIRCAPYVQTKCYNSCNNIRNNM